MTRPYSLDLRERALARFEAGDPIRSIGAALKISPSCVSKWARLKRETGGLKHLPIGGREPRTLSGEIAEWLRADGESTVHDTRTGGGACGAGRKTTRRAVWVFVRGEGLTFKKSLFVSEQDRPDVARRRARWRARQASVDPKRLVFIDETWIKTNMAPLRGWGRKVNA
jgi:transposase